MTCFHSLRARADESFKNKAMNTLSIYFSVFIKIYNTISSFICINFQWNGDTTFPSRSVITTLTLSRIYNTININKIAWESWNFFNGKFSSIKIIVS